MIYVRIGYARCSTDKQGHAAQRAALARLGVAEERIYTDHGMIGTTRAKPGLDQALAAVRAGDTLVVPKLDRLARSVPDAGRSPISSRRAASGWRLARAFMTRPTQWGKCSSTSSPPSPSSKPT